MDHEDIKGRRSTALHITRVRDKDGYPPTHQPCSESSLKLSPIIQFICNGCSHYLLKHYIKTPYNLHLTNIARSRPPSSSNVAFTACFSLLPNDISSRPLLTRNFDRGLYTASKGDCLLFRPIQINVQNSYYIDKRKKSSDQPYFHTVHRKYSPCYSILQQ